MKCIPLKRHPLLYSCINIGVAGEYLFSLVLFENIDFGYLLEPPTIYALSKNKKKTKQNIFF